MAESPPGEILVLAGTNGAGKSSVAGERLRAAGAAWFNPDEATRRLQAANPGLSLEEANSMAWHEGRQRLETAIATRTNYAFETTLGGNTIAALLARAAGAGMPVRVWYCALASAELHVARVKARVAKGGHDIPEAAIRKRYDDSRERLIELIPSLTELYVYDNSADAAGAAPAPMLLLHLRERQLLKAAAPAATPAWAKPILMAAFKTAR